jgi:SWI/SNF-related matrix-associated actin-dependent regulator 1 of chromatin subfamily A
MQITTRITDTSWTLSVGSWLKPGTRIYVAKSIFSENSMLAAKQGGAGFKWNPDKKCWWTADINISAKLSDWADPTCAAELDAVRKKNFEQITLSKAAEVPDVYPCPEGHAYLGYQKVGIKYGLQRDSTLLSDDCGLGKTMQAIGLLNCWSELKKILIICPANGKVMWYRKTKEWLVVPRKTGIGDRKTFPYPENGFEIAITNYDSLAKGKVIFENGKEKKSIEYFHPIDQIDWDVIIADEIHHCRNKDTIKAKALYGLKAKKKIGITGTPVYNKLIQLYAALAWLSPYWKKNYYFFIRRYCGAEFGRYGLEVGKPCKEHLQELNEKLRAELLIRRTEEDVGLELPPERWIVTEFEVDGKIKRLIDNEAEFKNKLRTKSDVSVLSLDSSMEFNQEIGFTDIARIRHETAVAKIPYVMEYIENLLEETEKIIVFSHHHEVQDAIIGKYKDEQVTLTGRTAGPDKKQAAEDRFQSDPTCRIFNGSIRASGELLTLTASNHVVFAEFDWLAATIEQCYKRSKRIGQTKSVVIHALVWAGSIDAKMANTMAEKKEIATLAIDGHKSA